MSHHKSEALQKTDFNKVLTYESYRYKTKKQGLVFAIFTVILFFYISQNYIITLYPTHIHNQVNFYILSNWIVHQTAFIVINLFFYFIYKLNHPFFENDKTTKNSWPWEENYEEWKILLKRTAKYLLFNQFVSLPLLLSFFYINNICPVRTDYESLPDILEIVIHFGFYIICEDFWSYFFHRLLHVKFLYPHIHKIHHSYRHVAAISAEFAHPIEFIITNTLATSIGSFLLGKKTHLYTFLLWMTVRMGETADVHSGYEFSWMPFRVLFLKTEEDFHNFHHLYFRDNYGSFFSFWDRVCGTVNERYIEFVNNRKEIRID